VPADVQPFGRTMRGVGAEAGLLMTPVRFSVQKKTTGAGRMGEPFPAFFGSAEPRQGSRVRLNRAQGLSGPSPDVEADARATDMPLPVPRH